MFLLMVHLAQKYCVQNLIIVPLEHYYRTEEDQGNQHNDKRKNKKTKNTPSEQELN